MINFIKKRTRHKNSEIYDLTFDDGLKAQVQFVPEYKHIKSKWQMVVSIHKSSKLVAGEFKTIDDAAKYAHKTKAYEKEWVKTHVKFS